MSSEQNQVVTFLRGQVKEANEFLLAVMSDVTAEQAQWGPPGIANPIGATFAHVLTSQDGLVNGTLKGGAPLMAGSWAGKTGFNTPPPGPSPENPGFPNWSEWGRSVEIDLAALREYAQAVAASVDDYLGSISDEELNKSLDLSAVGLGEMTKGYLLNVGVLANTQWHTGEISTLKGVQGAQGYPM